MKKLFLLSLLSVCFCATASKDRVTVQFQEGERDSKGFLCRAVKHDLLDCYEVNRGIIALLASMDTATEVKYLEAADRLREAVKAEQK
jgi:hypothetical protein